MSDSEKPAWQRAHETPAQDDKPAAAPESHDATPSSPASTDVVEQARKFLDDESVRNASVEKKTEFLKSKGLGEDVIQQLFEEPSTSEASSEPAVDLSGLSDLRVAAGQRRATQSEHITESSSGPSHDAPPIITYPEFLTTSPRPPPLMTPTRLANILTVSGTVFTLAYGAARFLINPMVTTLNESRADYYEHVSGRLQELNGKLEGVVSEVPAMTSRAAVLKAAEELEDDSSYDDPTELFHRDFGTQTSPPPSPRPTLATVNGTANGEKPVEMQARQLEVLSSTLRELTTMYNQRAESSADLHSNLREIRDEVDKLSFPAASGPYTYSAVYGAPSSDPDDEIKKLKDSIRSVKGLFLSTRSFPISTAAR